MNIKYKLATILTVTVLFLIQVSAFAADAPDVDSPFGPVVEDGKTPSEQQPLNTTEVVDGKTPPEQPPVDTTEEDGKTPPEQPPVDTTVKSTNSNGNGGGGSTSTQEETGSIDGSIGSGSQTGSDQKTHPAASDASAISETGPAAGILIIPSLIAGIVVKKRKKKYNIMI